jgi:hypothetical protein
MIVIASDTPVQSPLLTIASQCIAADFRVVVVYYVTKKQDDDTVELMLERKITSWTLCVETLLSFQKVVVEDIHDDSLLRSPYDANALLGAKVEHDALDEMLAKTGILPDVMVVCISRAYVSFSLTCNHSHSIAYVQIAVANVGAQLVAERHGIRSVLMAPDNMLSVVAEKTFPSTGPIDLFKRRKDSFFLAHRFMQMNKVSMQ